MRATAGANMEDAVVVPVGGGEAAAPRRPELRFCRECNDLMKPKVQPRSSP